MQLLWIPAAAIAALGVLVAAAVGVAFPEKGHHLIIFAAVLGLLAVLFATALFRSLEAGDVPGLERDWGGLGGEVGGWRMSLSLVYFIGSCVFATLAVCVFALPHLPPVKVVGSQPPPAQTRTGVPAGAGGAGTPSNVPTVAAPGAPVAPPPATPVPAQKAPAPQ